MRLTWVSGDKESQEVRYGAGKSQKSQVATFTQDDMCGKVLFGIICFHEKLSLKTLIRVVWFAGKFQVLP